MYRLHSNGAYWQVLYEADGKVVRKSLGNKAGLTKRAAQRIIDQMVQDHIASGVAGQARKTLNQWLERYLFLRASDLARSSRFIHERVCQSLSDFFGSDKFLEDVSRKELADWRVMLRKELAESTVCKYSRTAKVIFSRAVDEEWIENSPASKLRGTAPTIDPFSRRLITQDEVNQVLAWPGPHVLPVAIGWYAGLRTSEALFLRIDDVKHREGKIIVRTRGRVQTSKQRGREVRLEPELFELIQQALVYSHGPRLKTDVVSQPPQITVCGLLETGKKNMLARYVKQACQQVGVKPFTMRDLRRARDTIWHAKSPSHVCCAWLGHSESVARQHYLAVPDQYYSQDT